MQLLLCAGKVSGFYKLLLHLFLLCLKLLVLGRTDLPGQLHNSETAASSGRVKLFVRVFWGLPTLTLRSSQVQRGRRILCSSGLKMCVLCRYYPCWTCYGLFHSIQVLPWQSTLSNQNTHDTYSTASGFLIFFPGQCIFWRSPDLLSKKPMQGFWTLRESKPCLEFLAKIPLQSLVRERASDGRVAWLSLGGGVLLGSLCQSVSPCCVYRNLFAPLGVMTASTFFMRWLVHKSSLVEQLTAW